MPKNGAAALALIRIPYYHIFRGYRTDTGATLPPPAECTVRHITQGEAAGRYWGDVIKD